MARYRAQVSTPVDTALPRDRMVINPCFKDTGTSAPDTLAQDLATAVQNFMNGGVEVQVKLYDLDSTTEPNRPKAVKTVGAGALLSSSQPRELALCLSYYADTPDPRRRGRLYIPQAWLHKKSPLAVGARPSTQQMANAGTLVTALAGLGGADVDWVVWSTADKNAHTVTNWYVDDEWDIQRKRGTRPTTRTSGTTSG